MCGIAGIFRTDGAPVSERLIEVMTRSLAHRGPDGQGVFAHDAIGLGHRRLSIIDLSPAASQPMSTPDGRFTLTYNGEVFNFPELRHQLEQLGHQFRSRSDSEVVLHAFVEWGPRAVERFNGMFAFAVWDRVERKLFLARDRYGIKPLYYMRRGADFIFASEIKALLAGGFLQVRVNLEALLEYFTFQNYFTDNTMFEGVSLLPAGTWISLSTASSHIDGPHRYWDYDFREAEDDGRSEADYIEELDGLMQRAVQRQLVSDVEIGSYLSGGIDSGCIAALAARALPCIRTFTAGFDLNSASGMEKGFDEREAAEYMSYLFKTEHYEIVLKSGDMQRIMEKLMWTLEEPRLGQSYPIYYISLLASKFVKVVLAGTGGDELFAGYPWRYYRAVVNDDFDHYVDKYYDYWHRLIPNPLIQQVFKPIWPDVRHVSTKNIFRSVFSTHDGRLTGPSDYINHSLKLEARTFLHGLLVLEDKFGMAHGLETRFPFLDNDLVDFCMRVPVRMKLGNLGEVVRLNENEPGRKSSLYYQRTRDGKLLLRKWASRYLPDTVSQLPKQGFSGPDASWFKGESLEFVRERLFSGDSMIYQFLDRQVVQSLVTEHLEARENRRLLIWSLLSFDQWCRTFLGHESKLREEVAAIP